jgi:alkanesulfonate monooxygenase SsuD/methylene tetrahydromethanopterin reductase-like flavin-dependent oxidoreductase (luciferase family)
VVEEFTTFGVGSTEPRDRVERLRETLEVVTALWRGETVDHDGHHHQLQGARQEPRPLGSIPIVIGGVGRKTLTLVRDFADWWNVHVGHIDRIEELRPHVGDARVSVQRTVALVGRGRDREQVTALAKKRFGWSAPVVGTAPELVDYFAGLGARGVERVYTWFCDFAPPDTLAEFGEDVVPALT